MLKNAALDAKIGVDTAENEPRKGSENSKKRKKEVCGRSAEKLKLDVDTFRPNH